MAGEESFRVSDEEREHAITTLRDSLLEGRLTLEEFTERATLALRAIVGRDLDRLHADLPMRVAPSPSRRKRARFTAALFAHVVRRGRLRLGRRTTAISIFSDVDLDLRDASIEASRSSLTVFAFFGNVDVYVPEGIEVDVGGLVLFGHRRDWGTDVSMRDAPKLRVTVCGIFGAIDVWRVPRDLRGDYGVIIDRVKEAGHPALPPLRDERGGSEP